MSTATQAPPPGVEEDLAAERDKTAQEAAADAQSAAEAAGHEPMGEEQPTEEPDESAGRKPTDDADKGSSGETQTAAFDREAYKDPALRIPKVDGKDVDKIAVAFGGRVMLDRKNPDDVALMKRLQLGHDVELRIAGKVSSKKHGFTTNREGDLDAVVLGAAIQVGTLYVLKPEELAA